MRKTLWFVAVSAACGLAALCPTLSAQAGPAAAARPVSLDDTTIVRALYVNRWASQSPRRMRQLIALADSTEINALVIDMKDEFGLNFESTDPVVERNAGHGGRIPHLAELLDTLKAHRIRPIARLVVFKDSVAARVNPDHVIHQPNGQPWRDKKGLTWVDPYDTTIWDYDIRVAEEMARLGFAGAVRLHPVPRAVSQSAAAGVPRCERDDETAGAGAFSRGGMSARPESGRALYRRHLRIGDDGPGRPRGGPAVGAVIAEAGRAAADGVPVALPTRRVRAGAA